MTFEFEIGRTVAPSTGSRVDDADHLYGEGWVAQRTSAGYVLSWDGGELSSQTVEVAISGAEFERLREERRRSARSLSSTTRSIRAREPEG